MRSIKQLLLLAVVALGLSACAGIEVAPPPAALSGAQPWAVLPLENLTDTPMAGQRAAELAATVLSTRGVSDVQRYVADNGEETLFEPAAADQRARGLAWARSIHARYALTGSVIEWRYKVGVDGEPVVGLTLQLIDLESGKVIWRGAGHQEGWGNNSLAGVAAALSRKLLSPLTSAIVD
ncbi:MULTISPECIES: hypothetical protein [unclassified Paludibacterium]|uniref:hypothetical protein n=1 Tax=unclassified Paludibacterium TaxID=2618429 RepID=UPI001C049AD1|nr:hypothetical protein [Paludibacterium sp. B53371]BEV71945.1 pellicle/biofilm biosynthesis outer membrane protein PelC [Paludibacterium sp. THUN1379]